MRGIRPPIPQNTPLGRTVGSAQFLADSGAVIRLLVFSRAALVACCWVVLLVTTLPARVARADDEAKAAAAFDKGLADMMAGKYETGCPALAEAYELSSSAGALFTLAECEAKWGKLASALEHYRAYLRAVIAMDPAKRAAQAERQPIASRQVDALGKVVPRLTVNVKAPPNGAVVKLDGEVLAGKSLGRAQEIDPGSHELTLEAPGHDPVRESVELEHGDKRTVTLALSSFSDDDDDDDDDTTPSDDSSLETWAFVIGGVGVAGVIVGIATGAAAFATRSTVLEHCDDVRCDQEGKDAADKTKALGHTSTVGFVVGGVGLAAGTILYILAPGDDADESEVGWRLGTPVGGRGLLVELVGVW
jgi:hypothetical protein